MESGSSRQGHESNAAPDGQSWPQVAVRGAMARRSYPGMVRSSDLSILALAGVAKSDVVGARYFQHGSHEERMQRARLVLWGRIFRTPLFFEPGFEGGVC